MADVRPTIHTDAMLTAHDLHLLGEAARLEAVEWIAAHGFGPYAFQVEYDLIDCPLIRVWWLTPDEIAAVTDAELSAADGDLIPFAHVNQVALRRPLPAWWQPA